MSLRDLNQEAFVDELTTKSEVVSLIQQWLQFPNGATGRERIREIFFQLLNYIEANIGAGSAGFTIANTNTITLFLSGTNVLSANGNLSISAGNDLMVDGSGFYIDVSNSAILDTSNILGGGAINVTLQSFLDAIAPKATEFAGATAVGAADINFPTEGEIATWATTNNITNSIISYTGTNSSLDSTTSAFYVDPFGDVTALGTTNATNFIFADDTSVSPATVGNPTLTEIQTWASTNSIISSFIRYTGTDISGDPTTYLYYVASNGSIELIENLNITLNSFQFADDTSVNPTIPGDPSNGEIKTWTTANFITNAFVRYTGTDTSADPTTHLFYVDNAGEVEIIKGIDSDHTLNDWSAASPILALEPVVVNDEIFRSNSTRTTGATFDATEKSNFTKISWKPNDRVFIDETSLSPAIAGSPTVNEVNTYLGGVVLDSIIFYTGTNVNTDPITHVFLTDQSGVTTLVLSPTNISLLDEDDMVSNSAVSAPSQQSVKAHVAANKVQTNTSAPVNGVTTAWFVGQLYWEQTIGRMYRATSASTSPYTAATGSVWVEIDFGNAIVFASDSAVSPASSGSPTVSEIQSWATGLGYKGKFIYYTGTNTASNTPTYVYFVDRLGDVLLLEKPFIILDEDDMISNSAIYAPSQQSVINYVAANITQVGAGAPVNGTTTAWFIGQFYYDTTNDKIYVATTASTNPYSAATGSIWVERKDTKIKITVNPSAPSTLANLVTLPKYPNDIDIFIDGVYDYANLITVDSSGVVTISGSFSSTYGYILDTIHSVSFIYSSI